MLASRLLATAFLIVVILPAAASARARNVILVHGAAVDGSTWRDVYRELAKRGVAARVVQLPMGGFAADVAAARLILDDVSGSTILVGHSYGGEIITQLGVDPKVRGLVYVAAVAPDVGDSLSSLAKRFPPAAMHVKIVGRERFIPDPATLRADLAADLPDDTVEFLAASLKPTPFSAGTATVTEAAWKTKPSYGIVATKDQTISPALERFMYRRANAAVTEIPASHMVLMSHPREVADVIMRAVEAAD